MKLNRTLRQLMLTSALSLWGFFNCSAATFTVLNSLDAGPGSLRQAVLDANAAAGADNIDFAITTNGVPIVLLTGELSITEDVSITGNDTTNTVVSGGMLSRIFNISSAGTVTIDGVKMMMGQAVDGGAILSTSTALNLTDCALANNVANGVSGSGGGLFIAGGAVTVTNSSIYGNSANRAGGGIEIASGSLTMTGGSLSGNDVDGTAGAANPGNGGGLHVTTANTVDLTGVTVANNAAAQEGGGLWNNTGSTMTIDGGSIDSNTANAGNNAGNDQGGGGVFENGGTTIIQNGASITNNTAPINAGNGGGVMAVGGTVIITGSTIASNSCFRAGGGIENNNALVTISSSTVGGVLVADGNTAGINGGGMHVSGTGTTNVNGGTFANNTAGQEGGGLWNASGTMTIDATTIDSNTANAGNNAGNDQGGGGVFNIGGTLIIQNGATISNNMAMMNLGNGGGVMTDGGTVTITGSTIATNSCARAGGGIENFGGMVTVNTSTVGGALVADGNTAGINGGGMHVSGTGTTNVNGGSFANNTAGQEGGGLWNNAGTMTVDGTDINNNTANGALAAQGGGGLFNNGGTMIVQNGAMVNDNAATGAAGSGGGVFNEIGGTLSVTGSTVSGNVANRAGGGIEDNSGAGFGTTLTSVTLTNNIAGPAGFAAPGNGGGLHITGAANTSITGSTVTGNFAAAEGGGLWNGSGTMIVSAGTTVDSNAAAGNGADQGGGGLFNSGGTLDVTGGTVSNNVAAAATSFMLDGGQEVPPVATAATGSSIFQYDHATGTFRIDVYVTGIALADLVGSHIHAAAPAGMNAGVIVNLGTAGWVEDGAGIRLRSLNVAFPAANVADLFAGNAYVNVHTTANPGGEVRGQITFPATMGSGGGVLNDLGTLTVNGTMISGNTASRAGGGIESNVGSNSLTNVILNGNIAGPMDAATPGNGGGLHISGAGSATITGGTVNSNTAQQEGGGLWNSVSTMTIDATTIDGNTANAASNALNNQGGGGVFNNGGTLLIQNAATITNNTAPINLGNGGGVMTDGGTVTITGSTIATNSCGRAGGGIENFGGMVTVNASTVGGAAIADGNTAGINGGGMHVSGTGTTNVNGGTFANNTAGQEGGGLWNASGTMTIDATTIDSNTANAGNNAGNDQGGGGVFNISGTLIIQNGAMITNNMAPINTGNGGGVMTDGGSVTITGSTLSGNSSARAGGAIENFNGSASLTDITLSGNTAGINGGGMHVSGTGITSFTTSTASGNTALNEGGGLWASNAGAMTIVRSTVSGNNALDGGGLFLQGGGADTGTLEVNYSTVSGNTATNDGGGVSVEGGTATLLASTLANNTAANNGGGVNVMAGTLNSNSSIIADNSVTGAGTGSDANGAFDSAMFTLLEVGSGASGISNGVNGNVVGTDPGLGALANNGGTTETHAITMVSAAYNAGDPAVLDNDQRNFALFGTRDIGAFEFQDVIMGNNMLSLVFDLDAFGSEVTFQVTPAGGGAPVASGGPFADVPGGSTEVATFSVADGCFDLTVSDAGGNGITNGGYVLSTADGIRLIDNTDNFTSGATSMAAVPFCVPPSATDLLFTSCDKYFWKNGEYIVCNEDPAVAADYNGGGAAGADSGYDFLFFDPNGTYSYVRQRRHNVSDNFANIGSARTCHAKINNWAAADQIPNGVKLNVRVRTVVNGVAGAYGPACRFTRDEALGNCPPTKLFDVPGFPQFLSCNVTRDFLSNSANRLYARPVRGATQYRFTFTNSELVTPIVRVVSTYYVNLGWGPGVAPALTPGSTYDVTVEAFKGGAYCQAGESCTVTINSMVAGGQQNALLENTNTSSVLTLYPNPNQGTELTVSLNALNSELKTVSFEIMDMSGKLMVNKQLLTQDGYLNSVVALDGDLTSGMYLVRVIAGDRIYTDRIVIQP